MPTVVIARPAAAISLAPAMISLATAVAGVPSAAIFLATLVTFLATAVVGAIVRWAKSLSAVDRQSSSRTIELPAQPRCTFGATR